MDTVNKSHLYSVYEHIFPNGKRYIGLSVNPEKRWGKGGTNYAHNLEMTKAIKKYGWDHIQHNIVASGLSRNQAKQIERELIKKHDSISRGYNKSPGGTCGKSLYSPHVSKMLRTLAQNKVYDPVITKMHELADDEQWACQVNLVDVVMRYEIPEYELYANDVYLEACEWFYYLANWVICPEVSILNINRFSETVYQSMHSNARGGDLNE